jgi:hypothetical protein
VHEQVPEAGHGLQPLTERRFDDARLTEPRETGGEIVGHALQPPRRHVVAQAERCLDRDEQTPHRYVLHIAVGQELGPRHPADPVQPLHGVLDVTAARANQIGIESHDPNASRAAWSSTGATSKYCRMVSSSTSASRASSLAQSSRPRTAWKRNVSGAVLRSRTSTGR